MDELEKKKNKRAKAELNKLYPGLTNAEVTEIQRQRLDNSSQARLEDKAELAEIQSIVKSVVLGDG